MIARRTSTSTSFCPLRCVSPRQTMKRMKPHECSRVSQQHVSWELRSCLCLQTAWARIMCLCSSKFGTRSAGQTAHELWQHSAIAMHVLLQYVYVQACLFSLIMFIVGNGTGSSRSICDTPMGRHPRVMQMTEPSDSAHHGPITREVPLQE